MYRIVLGFMRCVAWLPWRVLYALADVLYFLLYYVVRYRRKAVRRNLTASFPELGEKEIVEIEKDFYRNFSDNILETVKLLHISEDEMRERMVFDDAEVSDRFLKDGRSVVAYFAHVGNWEWASSMPIWSSIKAVHPFDGKGTEAPDAGAAAFCQVYRPLSNKVFDRLMLLVRGRFGSNSLPKALTLRRLLELRREGVPSMTGFMSDQKPSHGDPTLPLMFLNQPTAMITGTETLARRLKMAVVYFDMEKVSRGHYRVVVRPVADDASLLEPMELTRRYASLLEATIRRNPGLWLWSHKRWKIPVTIPNNTENG